MTLPQSVFFAFLFSQLLFTSGQDSFLFTPFLLLLVGSRTCFRVDEFAVSLTFHQLFDYFKIPFANIFLLPCLPFTFEMDKAEVLFFTPTFPVTICTILVFSLSRSVRFFAEMKHVINKWEGPYSWLITTLRNTVICNSLNAFFAIYIYWKLILYVLVLSQWQITGKCIIKRELNSNLSSFLLEIILQLSYGPSSPFQCVPLCLFTPLFSLIFEFLSQGNVILSKDPNSNSASIICCETLDKLLTGPHLQFSHL